MSRDGFILILCNTSTLKEAKEISKKLLQDSLAACINIIKNECSIYRWENEICEESEYQLIIKTKSSLFEKAKSAIEKMHSYKVPEIVSLDITNGNESYLKWLSDSVS